MEITEELIEQSAKDPARLRLDIAVLMYDQEVWARGKAAAFAGMNWYDFEGVLKVRNITTGMMTIEDFEQDLRTIRHIMDSKNDSSK